jgi:hypothetical protein
VSGFNSEWRPASRRNRVRLQIGTLSGFKSESASGFIGIPSCSPEGRESGACDTLDRRRAQGRQLGELLLQPAALDSEFLGEHLRFFGCLLSSYFPAQNCKIEFCVIVDHCVGQMLSPPGVTGGPLH